MPSKEQAIKNSVILASYLIIVWGFYRLLFKLPEDIEDLVIKPLMWLVPVFLLVRSEKKGLSSLGITFSNFFPSIYSALVLGVIFSAIGILTNFLKYQGFNFTSNIGDSTFFTSIFLSLIVGVTEEITFRGFMFNRIWHGLGNEWTANLAVSVVWALAHIPIAVMWWKLNLTGTLGMLILITIYGIGASYIFARTKNVIAPILLHMLWGWPIILFR